MQITPGVRADIPHTQAKGNRTAADWTTKHHRPRPRPFLTPQNDLTVASGKNAEMKVATLKGQETIFNRLNCSWCLPWGRHLSQPSRHSLTTNYKVDGECRVRICNLLYPWSPSPSTVRWKYSVRSSITWPCVTRNRSRIARG